MQHAATGPAPAMRHRGLHVFARHWLNPLVLRLGLAGGRRSPLAVVHHVGRRTGRAYATPLAAHRRGDRLWVPLTYGPNARWCLNVMAAGTCRVQLHGRLLAAGRPRVVGPAALPQGLRGPYRLIRMREFLELALIDDSDGGAPRFRPVAAPNR